jgi:hypothetical protein
MNLSNAKDLVFICFVLEKVEIQFIYQRYEILKNVNKILKLC